MFEEQPAWTQATSLDILHKNIHTCTQCRLGTSRTNFVFGTGNPNADLVIIGEAPGADEDAQGIPFVGRAGQLLTKILEAINFSREDVYICNILKCRPPENRRPHADEVEQCEPYLYKQLALIQPKFILALGLTAAETLLKNKYKMAELRGSWVDYHGARMMVTYHPAALLRNPEWKKYAWEDVQHLRRCYDHYRTS
ncbi:MAG: uracil-DNA glycosylase, partial [Candidatus Kapabacteria bacterium]|nr:uracil-DNA glycosylase [Candidatus Kapabacteria bacterium]